MPRTGPYQFGFPRLQGAVRQILFFTLGVWVTVLLLSAFDRSDAQLLLGIGSLIPRAVSRGWIWQFFTYGFVHESPGHIFATMLGLFFIGSAVEQIIGKRAFFEVYIGSLVASGVVGYLLSLTGYVGFGGAIGAGAAVNAVLMLFYLFNRGATIYLFPFPFQIPVKYVVAIIAAFEAAYLLLNHFQLFYMVNLLGFGAGYLWYRYMPRRGFTFAFSEGLFNMRNAYHRWKRRRATRKFQVYMRKHQHDPKQYFDEYGNFKPPEDAEKKDGGQGGWVN
jgi:membrane associated rhomboid family serine protease